MSVNLVPLLWTGVRHHPPGRTDTNLCRCFGVPACRVFPDHLIDRSIRGSGRRLVMGSICLLSDGGLPSVCCFTHYSFVARAVVAPATKARCGHGRVASVGT